METESELLSTEDGICDFCGEDSLCAVSDQTQKTVRICSVCAVWANDLLNL